MDAEPRLEQLDRTLEHLERLCGRLEHAERHFKHLTDDCTGVLQGLVAVDRQHASAVAGLNERLGDWCRLEGKLLEESARRIGQFERGVSHEWMALRQLNEEPIAELREEAEGLRRACLEMVGVARLRLEAAEEAYAAKSAALERRLGEWQRPSLDRPGTVAAVPASGVEPWSLEGVAQLHQELRSGTAVQNAVGLELRQAGDPAAAGARRAEASPADVAPPDRAAGRGDRWRWRAVAAVAALGAIALIVALIAFSVRQDRGAVRQAPPLPPRDQAGHAAASPAARAADEDARRRETEARQVIERAGLMVEILAAPDLLRYTLVGTGPAPQAYAQALWSRSRGLAVTASRLPAPPDGLSYWMWVISAGEPALLGPLVPDANGRASVVVTGPLTLPRLVGFRVTLEDRKGSDRPTGVICLTGGPTS